MLIKFAIICDEVEDFRREILIDEDATFLDFNKAILDACNYSDDQITSFYICNDYWEQKDQITREDMGVGSADKDIFIMEKTPLCDFISEKDQKLVFVFDPFNERLFYIKVVDTITGKTLKKPECTLAEGEPPTQLADINAATAAVPNVSDTLIDDDSTFFGSDEFDQEDFDPEGFEIEEH